MIYEKLEIEQDIIADLEEEYENVLDDLEELKADINDSQHHQNELRQLLKAKQIEYNEKAEGQLKSREDMQKSMGMKGNHGEDLNMTAMGCNRKWWHPSPAPSTAEPLVVYF